MPPNIEALQKAIRETHGCESQHVTSEQVYESFEGRTAWQGTVEVFDLIDHPTAKRAYAWTYQDHGQNKTVTVLGIPPVDSPQNAVKIAIASKGRPDR
jgi:hypothetical protein